MADKKHKHEWQFLKSGRGKDGKLAVKVCVRCNMLAFCNRDGKWQYRKGITGDWWV